MEIATSLGWHTGSRSDDTISDQHRPLHLLDIHWSDYDWPAHVAVARAERPALAAVPDIETPGQLPEAMAMAEEIAPYCGSVLLIPKCDVWDRLPRAVAGVPVTIGYSVPTAYGGTNEPIWSFCGWQVHLLGGTPKRQIRLARYLNVASADGNMAQKLANRGLVFSESGEGVPMDRYEPIRLGPGLPQRALALSLRHIADLWRRAGFVPDERSATDGD